MRRLLLASALLTGSAYGQSFNIDIDIAGAQYGGGAPANAFGGAAGTPGTWNVIGGVPGLTTTLKGLNGATTGVKVQTSGTIITLSANEGYSTGEFAKLMEDGWQTASSGDSMTYKVTGLEPGAYFVYTYGDPPDSTQQETRVTINGVFQNCGGSHNTNEFILNVTHTRHFVELAAGQSIDVTITNNPFVSGARAFLAGMQIQKLPQRLYVNAAAASGGDGLSWASAFASLQDAIDAVSLYGGAIDEVWVAKGTYLPATGTYRGDTFDLPDGVKFYGGFAGNETQLSQRDYVANPTFLSGSIGSPGIADNSYHVVTAWDCGYATELDGFTIASGNANGTLGWDMHGGGMWIRESQLTVRNCTFVGNYGWRGGAIGIQDALPVFENCYFFNNTAEQSGGAIYTLTGGSAKIKHSTFRYNHATVNYGGAIAHYDGTNMYVFNTKFLDNDANWGGGAIFSASGSTLVGNCVFTGNSGAADRGGAMHTFGDTTFLFVYNSAVYGNHAYQCGGVDAFADAKVYLRNSIVWGNTDNDPNTNLEGAQVRKEIGGAATLSVVRCDVQGWSGILGGTGNFGLDPQFIDPDGNDNILGTLDDDLRLAAGSPCIDSGSNTSIPQDSADVDNDNNVIEPLPIDLDGNARRLDDPATPDTGEGTAPFVDMGAYEFSPSCLGDLNGDGKIDQADLGLLLSTYGLCEGQPGYQAIANLAPNQGTQCIDQADLGVLLSVFGQNCP